MEENEREEELWSWGAGTDGQLGTGRLEDEHLPQHLLPFLSPARTISQLACGGAHAIALTSGNLSLSLSVNGGGVLTWGRGTSGQLGHAELGNSLRPKPVKFLESFTITYVSAGWNHSGFVSDTGHLFTCGDGSFGQLGHGDYQSHCFPVEVLYFGSKHVEQIACGMRHSLVLLKGPSGDQVYGFGSGKRGQLGISKDRIKSLSLPQIIFGFEDVEIISIGANGDHSAALSADGHLYTWGRGFSGTKDAYLPQILSSHLRFSQVALGWNHALLLTGDNEVLMLGGNQHGMLSDPQKMSLKQPPSVHRTPCTSSDGDSMEPILDKVPGLNGIKVMHIAAGAEHSALVTGKLVPMVSLLLIKSGEEIVPELPLHVTRLVSSGYNLEHSKVLSFTWWAILKTFILHLDILPRTYYYTLSVMKKFGTRFRQYGNQKHSKPGHMTFFDAVEAKQYREGVESSEHYKFYCLSSTIFCASQQKEDENVSWLMEKDKLKEWGDTSQDGSQHFRLQQRGALWGGFASGARFPAVFHRFKRAYDPFFSGLGYAGSRVANRGEQQNYYS
ncbi:hypothetical protein HHK36_029732 [Tetracentron sinense]|uniref:RCC1-like domain-containing protein n=1 Tax=Tetracentron sinense TaxID=13715 RepID=A0A834YBF4_TETSI|nr:hypothetical protein HHK36_029732 [Tetracentron sinense]